MSDRQEILFALERTFEMLQDEEIRIINNAPKIPQLVPNKGIIKRYFNSSLRKEYFQKIVDQRTSGPQGELPPRVTDICNLAYQIGSLR